MPWPIADSVPRVSGPFPLQVPTVLGREPTPRALNWQAHPHPPRESVGEEPEATNRGEGLKDSACNHPHPHRESVGEEPKATIRGAGPK